MRRRQVLTGIAAATAGAGGCLEAAGVDDLLGGKPLLLRAMRTDPEGTDVRCSLPASVVEAHPPLRDVLRGADATAKGEWATRGIGRDAGDAIRRSLEETCETAGGLYEYGGSWYFISIRFEDADDAAEHHGDGHEH